VTHILQLSPGPCNEPTPNLVCEENLTCEMLPVVELLAVRNVFRDDEIVVWGRSLRATRRRRPPTRRTRTRSRGRRRARVARGARPTARSDDAPGPPPEPVRPAWGAPVARAEIVDELRRRMAAPPRPRTPYSWLAPDLVVLAQKLGHRDLVAGVFGKQYFVGARDEFLAFLRRDRRLLEAQAIDHPAPPGLVRVFVFDPRTNAARVTRVRIGGSR